MTVNTPFLRAWTKILPSTESAKRIPSGFSRVTMYSFKFILNDEPFDIAKILTVRSFSLRLVSIVDRPMILMRHVSVPQNEEEEPPPRNGGDERARALQLGSCRMSIFFFFLVFSSKKELKLSGAWFRLLHTEMEVFNSPSLPVGCGCGSRARHHGSRASHHFVLFFRSGATSKGPGHSLPATQDEVKFREAWEYGFPLDFCFQSNRTCNLFFIADQSAFSIRV